MRKECHVCGTFIHPRAPHVSRAGMDVCQNCLHQLADGKQPLPGHPASRAGQGGLSSSPSKQQSRTVKTTIKTGGAASGGSLPDARHERAHDLMTQLVNATARAQHEQEQAQLLRTVTGLGDNLEAAHVVSEPRTTGYAVTLYVKARAVTEATQAQVQERLRTWLVEHGALVPVKVQIIPVEPGEPAEFPVDDNPQTTIEEVSLLDFPTIRRSVPSTLVVGCRVTPIRAVWDVLTLPRLGRAEGWLSTALRNDHRVSSVLRDQAAWTTIDRLRREWARAFPASRTDPRPRYGTVVSYDPVIGHVAVEHDPDGVLVHWPAQLLMRRNQDARARGPLPLGDNPGDNSPIFDPADFRTRRRGRK